MRSASLPTPFFLKSYFIKAIILVAVFAFALGAGVLVVKADTYPTASVAYDRISLTNGNVRAIIIPSEPVTITNNGGSAVYTFTSNGSFTFYFTSDVTGNTGSATAVVSNIDKIAPTATVSYNVTLPTNGNVTATISPSESVTITNNSGLAVHTFTTNGSFTFNFTDTAGNPGSATAVVSNIDKIAPTATVSYNVTLPTNGNVTATISPSESVTITNNGGSAVYTFTANGSFTFNFTDVVGNPGSVTATVSNIDKTAPVITLVGLNPVSIFVGGVYSESGATSADVVDGPRPVNISGSVNTALAGAYTITYTSMDIAGNIATATRAVNVIADVTPPTNPVASSSTHTEGTISLVTSGNFYWTISTDVGGTGVAGYSYVLDGSAGTIPDNVTDTILTSIPQTLVAGNTYYFHLKSLDNAGNPSATSHIGPFIITDSSVLFFNSTIGGVFYSLAAPTIASSTALGITGTSTLTSSVSTGGTIFSSILTNSTSTASTISLSTISGSTIATSTLTSATITGSTVSNSTLNGVTVATSTVSNNSFIAGGSLTNASLSGATSTNSIITGGTISNSTTTNSTLLNAIVSGSTLANVTVLGTGSTIINTNLGTTTVTNAVIINGVMTSGSIVLPNGSTTMVVVPTPIVDLVNFAPVASFSTSSTGGLNISITDISSDPNAGTALPDSWVYSWDFGDGSTLNASVATTSNNQTHSYASSGTYILALTLTDQYGLSSTATSSVTVTGAPGVFSIVSSVSGAGVGTITPLGTTTVAIGGSQAYSIVVGNATSTIANLIIDGIVSAPSASYTFTNLGGDHTITADFATVATSTGPALVNLLSANNFAILTETGITDVPASVITGDIGSSPISGTATLVTCAEVTGTIYSVDASGPLPCRVTNATTLTNAVNDMTTAYTDAAGRTNPTATELGGGNIGGMTLAPGLYKWSTGVTIPTSVTLSGNASSVWIFQISGDLSIASGGSVPAGVKVLLTGGAQASNIFWQVGGPTGATLGTYSTFNGNILSAKQVIMQTGAVLNGRAFAQTQVTLNTNTVSIPSSSLPSFTLTATSTGPGSVTPVGASLVSQGASQSFTLTPNNASTTLTSLLIDGLPVATTSPYIFTNVSANHTLDATFATSTVPVTSYNIVSTVSGLGVGTITPLGTTTVAIGGSQAYTILPSNATSTLASLTIDGISVGTTSAYTFTNVISNHTIDATFATTTPPVVPDTTAPVITILGFNPIASLVGSVYTDPGATALDAVDGNVAGSIITANSVSTSTPGTYSVVYTVSDAVGNTASSTRTVHILAVPDITPPVITVNGSASTTAVVGTSYVDLGATAIDAVDGNITPSIVTTNPVNISVLGTYTVTYNVHDSSGNSATTTTLNATLSAVWTNSTDNSGSLAGYSFVWDNASSTIPDNITEVSATTTTATLANGTWYFHVVAVDPSLNVSTPASHFGPVVVSNAPAGDTTLPVGPTLVTSPTHTAGVSSATTTVDLSWDTATDNVALAGYAYLWDGTASSTPGGAPVTTATTLTTNVPNGTWYFHIRSVDTSGNTSSTTVDFGPVIIATTTTDVISPVGPTVVTSASHTVSVPSSNQNVTVSWDMATDDTVLAGYSYVWDNATSTLPGSIPNTGATTVTTTLSSGTWYFHIRSADTSGNISTPSIDFGPVIINTSLPADLIPPSAPVVTAVNTLATTTLNATLSAVWTNSTDNSGSLAGYSFVWDNASSTIPDNITEVSATTTTATLPNGTWYFHVVAIDPLLNVSTPTSNFGPVVIDTVAPVLTLVGGSTVTLVVGSPYVDAGATAVDTIAGNVTPSIVATSTVNMTLPGTYTVTYNVSDSSGNNAAPINRTVQVLAVADVISPVITIIGANPATAVLGTSYTDAGAIATDNVDGNLTSSISALSTVNISSVGAYAVNYSVSDSSGNTATSSRAVNVIVPATFTIFASSVGNGTTTPSATSTVIQGNSQVYTITPNFGHSLVSLLVDGVSVPTAASYTFANVQANHTINAIFAPIPGAPNFTVTASAGANGTITPLGTSTIAQGNNATFAIAPDSISLLGTLTVDGVSVATTTSHTFSNINANHTIAATFVPDTATPSTPISSSSTHTVGQVSSTTSAIFNWTASTDAGGSGLAGYSFVLDNVASTTPDNIVDTAATSTAQLLTIGNTYYFHIKALDTAGNSSNLINIGPYYISDANVLIQNSTLGGTYYAFYIPTAASSTALNITGNSTIRNSTTTAPWSLTDTNLDTVNFASSTLVNANATSSTITNSVLSNCSILNSLVKNYTASSCDIQDSIIDPPAGQNDLTGTTVNGQSQIYFSDVTYSYVSNSYIATSTISNSTLINATSTNSTMATSTLINGTIDFSNLSFATVNGSSISASTLLNTNIATSTITNNSLVSGGGVTNATLNSATSTNSSIVGGSVTQSTLTNATSTGSTISNNSSLTNSTAVNAILNGATLLNGSSVTGGSVSTSTISGAVLNNATTSGATITGGSITNAFVNGSSLTGVTILGTGSTITGSILASTTLTNAVIVGNVMTSGSVLLPNGTTQVIVAPTPVANIVNFPPAASFTPSASGAVVTLSDLSTDINSGLPIGDSYTYVWNFGDGTIATTTSATIGNSPLHTYAVSGTYTITLTVTDAFGGTSTSIHSISVTVPGAPGGGGGGSAPAGGGGNGPVSGSSFSFASGGGTTHSASTNATATSTVVTTTTTTTTTTETPKDNSILQFKFTKALRLGSSGVDVTKLQERLTYEGVYGGPVSGYFGELTFGAVKLYQTSKGIESVGVVGPVTRASLNGEKIIPASTVPVKEDIAIVPSKPKAPLAKVTPKPKETKITSTPSPSQVASVVSSQSPVTKSFLERLGEYLNSILQKIIK